MKQDSSISGTDGGELVGLTPSVGGGHTAGWSSGQGVPGLGCEDLTPRAVAAFGRSDDGSACLQGYVWGKQ